jgi:hypothetical protein
MSILPFLGASLVAGGAFWKLYPRESTTPLGIKGIRSATAGTTFGMALQYSATGHPAICVVFLGLHFLNHMVHRNEELGNQRKQMLIEVQGAEQAWNHSMMTAPSPK